MELVRLGLLLGETGAEPLALQPLPEVFAGFLLVDLERADAAGSHRVVVMRLHHLVGTAVGTLAGRLQRVVDRLGAARLADDALFGDAPVVIGEVLGAVKVGLARGRAAFDLDLVPAVGAFQAARGGIELHVAFAHRTLLVRFLFGVDPDGLLFI